MKLSNTEISDMSRELALLLHAGVAIGDGLHLLSGEEKDKQLKAMYARLAEAVEAGAFLSKACEDEGCFPVYVTGLINVGEKAGRLEDTLNALAVYYDEKDRMQRKTKSALVYPIILLLLMLVVIVVLLGKVLPVFNDIYASLGGRLTGIAGGLLKVGTFIDGAMPVLVGVLAVIIIAAAVFFLNRKLNEKFTAFWSKRFGDRGISKKLNNARFAQALSMGFASGLPMEEAVDMAAGLLVDTPKAAKRAERCAELLREGKDIAHALGETELISPAAARLLTLGIRSGKP